MEWIPVTEQLPEDGQTVLALWWNIHCRNRYNYDVMTFQKGRTAEEMINAKIISGCDEWGNNKRPYRWRAWGGNYDHFGQDVFYWMPIPDPPEEGK